ELIAAWPWDTDAEADTILIALIARTGTDAIVASAAEAVNERESISLHGLIFLAPRLTLDQRSVLAGAALRKPACSLEMAKAIAGGTARLDDPLGTPAGVALLAALQKEDAKPTDHAGELHALGLIAGRAAARRTLERLTAAGLVHGDPRLDMLRLNDAL